MDQYGSDFITIVDEDGTEFELEVLLTTEYNGQTYMAFIPAEMSVEDAYEPIIMKTELQENGEEMLITIDDDDEFDKVEDYFNDLLFGEADYDA